MEGESAILLGMLEDALEGGSAILSGTPEGDSDGGNAILEWLLILEWCRYVATEFEI